MTETATTFRLPAERTSPAALVQQVHRRLKGRHWARIEVRFSSQTAGRFPIDMVRDQLAALASEAGLKCAVSVRPIEMPLDDALGQHIVRLVPPPGRPEVQALAAGGGWRTRLLKRWPLLARFGGAPAAAQPERESLAEASELERQAEPQAAAVSQRQATELLLRALAAAVADEVPALAKVPVRRVVVTVRNDALHTALRRLTVDDAPRAADWLRRQLLETHRFAVDPVLQLLYRHEPKVLGEGTRAAGGGDLELHLLRELAIEPDDTAPAPAPAAADAPVMHEPMPLHTAASAPQTQYETALPRTGGASPVDLPTAMPVADPVLCVRVLGTTQGPYDKPFELHFDRLPARFDRAALVDAGFGQAHGEAISVVSQSCPLTVDRGPDGGLRVQAGLRRTAGAVGAADAGRAMYFRDDTRAPIVGTVDLHNGREVLIVNDPHTVVDPRSGARLHPLVIELHLAQ